MKAKDEDAIEKRNVRKIGRKAGWKEVDTWVERYQAKHDPETTTYGWLYGCDVLEELLKYKGCEGIWFFKGINDEGKERLVLYPADEAGKILGKNLKSLGAAARSGGPQPADFSDDCPPNCP